MLGYINCSRCQVVLFVCAVCLDLRYHCGHCRVMFVCAVCFWGLSRSIIAAIAELVSFPSVHLL